MSFFDANVREEVKAKYAWGTEGSSIEYHYTAESREFSTPNYAVSPPIIQVRFHPRPSRPCNLNTQRPPLLTAILVDPGRVAIRFPPIVLKSEEEARQRLCPVRGDVRVPGLGLASLVEKRGCSGWRCKATRAARLCLALAGCSVSAFTA